MQSDLQVAAVGWLAQHMLFARLANAWPDRVRTLNSETLLENPLLSLAALDRLFRVDDSNANRERVVATIFNRHAKFGETFTASDRKRDQRATADTHGEEIAMVASWATKVAEGAGVAMELPNALLTS